ncbi:hypothetical protein [Bradyrhizobium canariense]|nr:hypothetical protein [Bradyrhizobium canariense]
MLEELGAASAVTGTGELISLAPQLRMPLPSRIIKLEYNGSLIEAT